ncbi:MAG: cob(I)yrinic acid a,c-diamide adenosyltransferase [Limnochordia bacterium]|jgi:cob(I)alamin adenosyltransferase
MERLGLIHVYTGAGKGKTTAALGLAMRALGHGYRVAILGFCKHREDIGEEKLAQRLPDLFFRQFGSGCFIIGEPTEQDRQSAREGWLLAQELLAGRYQLVILDEISHVINKGLLDVEEVISRLAARPAGVEVVLTGRDMPEQLVAQADVVTEMVEIKHPYQRGIQARRGIEY